MFSEQLCRAHHSKSVFQDTVRDPFGQSVIENVFEPLISEAAGLAQMSEEAEKVIMEVDMLLQEAAGFGGAYA
jgi:hypothetical protein